MSKRLLGTRTLRVADIDAKGTSGRMCTIAPIAKTGSKLGLALFLALLAKVSDVDSTSYAFEAAAWDASGPGHPMVMVTDLSGLKRHSSSRLEKVVSNDSAVLKRE